MTSAPRQRHPKSTVLSTVAKVLLFWANFLLVLFASKRLFSPPGGALDFVAKNLGTFICSLILTGIMVYAIPHRFLWMVILVILMIAVLVGIT